MRCRILQVNFVNARFSGGHQVIGSHRNIPCGVGSRRAGCLQQSALSKLRFEAFRAELADDLASKVLEKA
jgi:hypothetical protein